MTGSPHFLPFSLDVISHGAYSSFVMNSLRRPVLIRIILLLLSDGGVLLGWHFILACFVRIFGHISLLKSLLLPLDLHSLDILP